MGNLDRATHMVNTTSAHDSAAEEPRLDARTQTRVRTRTRKQIHFGPGGSSVPGSSDGSRQRAAPDSAQEDTTERMAQRALTALRALPTHWNQWIVSAYKVLGFVFLGAILLGLSSYLGLHCFFFINHSWMTPAVVSPTDPKVLAVSSQLAQESLLHGKLHSEHLSLLAQHKDLERTIALEAAFQERLRTALASELRVKRGELDKLLSLAQRARAGEREIARVNRAFSGISAKRADQLLGARMIGQTAYTTAQQQLAALEAQNLSLSERSVTLDRSVKELERQTQALLAVNGELDSAATHARVRRARQSVLPIHDELGSQVDRTQTQSVPVSSPPRGGQPMTYELVNLRHEYDRSVADVDKARDTLAGVSAGLSAVDAALSRHGRLIEALESSPYYRAWENRLAVAFVPYDNLDNVEAHAPVYGCDLGPLACEPVGMIVNVLPGEVVAKHPIRSHELRGVLVELALNDKTSVEHKVLHAGSAPFLL